MTIDDLRKAMPVEAINKRLAELGEAEELIEQMKEVDPANYAVLKRAIETSRLGLVCLRRPQLH